MCLLFRRVYHPVHWIWGYNVRDTISTPGLLLIPNRKASRYFYPPTNNPKCFLAWITSHRRVLRHLYAHLFLRVVKGQNAYTFHPSDSLIRGHLNSRSSNQKSDSAVYYLARRVVQVGLFAMIWAILGLVAFIFMPKVCSLFDMTLGTIYTHVSISKVLLSLQIP